MAKFCSRCGKKLEEGAVCDCAPVTKEVKTGDAVETAKKSLFDCLNIFKKIFTKPFDAIKTFVVENKFIAGIIMVVLSALSAGIYKLASLKSVYGAKSMDSISGDDLMNMFSSALSGESFKPAYFKEFITTFVVTLAMYALIILIGYLIVTKLFKGKATIKQMINALGISLALVLGAYLVNSLLVFVDGSFMTYVRSAISSFANITHILVLGAAVYHVSGIDKDKLFVSVASMSVLATFVSDLFSKIFN